MLGFEMIQSNYRMDGRGPRHHFPVKLEKADEGSGNPFSVMKKKQVAEPILSEIDWKQVHFKAAIILRSSVSAIFAMNFALTNPAAASS